MADYIDVNPGPTTVNEQISLRIVNRNVIVPDLPKGSKLSISDALVAVPNAIIERKVNQYFFILPEFNRSVQYPIDWFNELRLAAN